MNESKEFSGEELGRMKKYSEEDLQAAIESVDRGPKGGRFAHSYEIRLGISLRGLEGKRVLDLGSGSGLRFANDLKKEFIKADVVSFSPIFANEKYRQEMLQEPDQKSVAGAVAGMGENLPFADAAFDYILCQKTLQHIHNPDNQIAFLREMVRVLKSGGSAIVGPIFFGAVVHPGMTKDEVESIFGSDVKLHWSNPVTRKDGRVQPSLEISRDFLRITKHD